MVGGAGPTPVHAADERGSGGEQQLHVVDLVAMVVDRVGTDRQAGCQQLFVPRSAQFDLTREEDIRQLLQQHKPDIVIHLAAVVGAVVDHELVTSASRPAAAQSELVADPGTWTPVTASSEVATGKVVRFVTTSAVGFVSRSSGQLRAVLGTCTHQGCLLALNQAAGRLECPCHGVWFTPSGEVLNQKLPQVLPSLPRLPVRERDGRVEVYLPPKT